MPNKKKYGRKFELNRPGLRRIENPPRFISSDRTSVPIRKGGREKKYICLFAQQREIFIGCGSVGRAEPYVFNRRRKKAVTFYFRSRAFEENRVAQHHSKGFFFPLLMHKSRLCPPEAIDLLVTHTRDCSTQPLTHEEEKGKLSLLLCHDQRDLRRKSRIEKAFEPRAEGNFFFFGRGT